LRREPLQIPGLLVATAALAISCSSSSGPPPAAADVQAARACEMFSQYLNHKATGQQIIDAVQPLVAGTAQARAASQPAPLWSDLGANLAAAGADINAGDTAKLTADGNKAADECGSIPTNAKRAGGYTR
jgi:hypothetical protein